MDIRTLRTFVTVAKTNGFSAAARVLNTVQPAVSRQISDLEAELGVSLFQRTTRQVRLTAAGQLLRTEAEAILAHEVRARELVQRAGRGQIGQLRVGFLGSACQAFLPQLIRTYATDYPDVEISLFEMSGTTQIEELTAGRIDISLSRGMPRAASVGIKTVPIYADRLMAFLPQHHPMADAGKIALADLSDERFLLYNRNGAPILFDLIISACRNSGFSPNISQQTNTMQALLTAVSSGLGIAIAPGCIRKLEMTDCACVSLADATSEVPFNLHYNATTAGPQTMSLVQSFEKAKGMIRQQME